MLLAPALMWGQGSCVYSHALTARQGFSNLAAVVPGATIAVSPGPIYTDNTLSTVLSTSPNTTSDQFGNYSICAAPGTQTVIITGPNLQSFTYKQSFGVQTSSSLTWTGTQIFSGPVTFGSTVTFSGTSFSNPTISGTLSVNNIQATTGSTLTILGGGCSLFTCNGSNLILGGGQGNISGNPGLFSGTQFLGPIVSYNNIATLGNGIPAEYAVLDVTAQSAAIATAPLYAVPAGTPLATQYRVAWNAKITTAATTSSTLGALTLTYVDPDGTTQTVTASASIEAGTIATTSTVNTVNTALFGTPLVLNVKANTTISYAFGYASVGATAMQYNLHIRLEAM